MVHMCLDRKPQVLETVCSDKILLFILLFWYFRTMSMNDTSRRYITLCHVTSTLDEGERSASRPGRFTPVEITPRTIVLEAEWAPEPVWTS
jgi:hypothetical protein